MVAETFVKLLWFVLASTFAIAAWVTRVEITQQGHSDEIKEIKPEIKEVSRNVNYIKGWVEAQPQPKRRRD